MAGLTALVDALTLQEQRIAATVKHFAGNESETERMSMSSNIDGRTLREVYLAPFEATVKHGGTSGVMSSCNRISGTFAAQSHWLLTKVRRDDRGYDGIVMSGWFWLKLILVVALLGVLIFAAINARRIDAGDAAAKALAPKTGMTGIALFLLIVLLAVLAFG